MRKFQNYKRKAFMLILVFTLIINLSSSQIITEGGNITNANFSEVQNSTTWIGAYGFLENGLNNSIVTSFPLSLNEINLSYTFPPGCNLDELIIVATNSTSFSFSSLTKGNLTLLDLLINSSENASLTFKLIENISIGGAIINDIPTTYSNSFPIRAFPTYYLNDNEGNLYFLTTPSFNTKNWKNSFSDYQLLFPNISGIGTMFLEVIPFYSCNPKATKKHDIEILPLENITLKKGESEEVNIIIRNLGDEGELTKLNINGIEVSNFYVRRGKSYIYNITVTGQKAGIYEYVVEAEIHTEKEREVFYVIVLEEEKEEPKTKEPQIIGEGLVCSEGICYVICKEKPRVEYKELTYSLLVYVSKCDAPFYGYIEIDGKKMFIEGSQIIEKPKTPKVIVYEGDKKYVYSLSFKRPAYIKIKNPYVGEIIYGEIKNDLGETIGEVEVSVVYQGKIKKVVYTNESSVFSFVVEKEGVYYLFGKDLDEKSIILPIKVNISEKIIELDLSYQIIVTTLIIFLISLLGNCKENCLICRKILEHS